MTSIDKKIITASTPLIDFLNGWDPMEGIDPKDFNFKREVDAFAAIKASGKAREQAIRFRCACENALGASLRSVLGIVKLKREEASTENVEDSSVADLPDSITNKKDAKKAEKIADKENRQESLIKRLTAEVAEMYHQCLGDKFTKQIPVNRVFRYIEEHLEKNELLRNIGVYQCFINYANAVVAEKNHEAAIKAMLEHVRLYTQFLKNIEGIGPMASATLITYLDINKATYPSHFVAYAGMGVVRVNLKDEDGEVVIEDGAPVVVSKGINLSNTPFRKAEVIDEVTGEVTFKSFAGYSHVFRARLHGSVMYPIIINGESEYARIFQNRRETELRKYEQRLKDEAMGKKNLSDTRPTSKLHANRRAQRVATRILLEDLWLVWEAMYRQSERSADRIVPYGEKLRPHNGTRPFMRYVSSSLARTINDRVNANSYMLGDPNR